MSHQDGSNLHDEIGLAIKAGAANSAEISARVGVEQETVHQAVANMRRDGWFDASVVFGVGDHLDLTGQQSQRLEAEHHRRQQQPVEQTRGRQRDRDDDGRGR